MTKILATYSPCCKMLREGDCEKDVMHCSYPHEQTTIRLVDAAEYDKLQAQNKILLDALETIKDHTLAWCQHNGQTECREWMRKVAEKAWEEVQK
jgi:hypothetical protein